MRYGKVKTCNEPDCSTRYRERWSSGDNRYDLGKCRPCASAYINAFAAERIHPMTCLHCEQDYMAPRQTLYQNRCDGKSTTHGYCTIQCSADSRKKYEDDKEREREKKRRYRKNLRARGMSSLNRPYVSDETRKAAEHRIVLPGTKEVSR